MKIAVISDDGQTISRHFGRATHYLVATIENGQISKREMREKMSHHHPGHTDSAGEGQPNHESSQEHHLKHANMAQAIADCEVLLCGGMGTPAYESMRTLGIRPVVTELSSVDEAIMAYLDGNLVDRVDLLH